MTETQQKREFKYRLYFRLMDLALFAFAIMVVDRLCNALFDLTFLANEQMWSKILFQAVIVTIQFIPLFLMLARFMRDDYAETLWKRSVVVLAYVTTLIPFSIWTGAWLTHAARQFFEPMDAVYKAVFTPLFGEWDGSATITGIWQLYLMLFLVIFQFLRWKDTR